jgi:hypothetical protein
MLLHMVVSFKYGLSACHALASSSPFTTSLANTSAAEAVSAGFPTI